jgi:hypothetical protein
MTTPPAALVGSSLVRLTMDLYAWMYVGVVGGSDEDGGITSGMVGGACCRWWWPTGVVTVVDVVVVCRVLWNRQQRRLVNSQRVALW